MFDIQYDIRLSGHYSTLFDSNSIQDTCPVFRPQPVNGGLAYVLEVFPTIIERCTPLQFHSMKTCQERHCFLLLAGSPHRVLSIHDGRVL